MNKDIWFKTLILFVFLGMILAGCAGSSAPESDYIMSEPAPYEEEMGSSASRGVVFQEADYNEEYSVIAVGEAQVPEERLVIKDANLVIVVDDPSLSLDRITRLAEGVLQLQYKVPLPATLRQRLVPHPSGSLHLRVGYELTPRYRDVDRSGTRSLKHALSLTARLQPYGMWFAEIGLRAHPVSGQQQPWDPDFVYGFGLADWRPGSISVQYYNYSGNRYPGRDRAAGTGRFRDGTVSVSWRWRL